MSPIVEMCSSKLALQFSSSKIRCLPVGRLDRGPRVGIGDPSSFVRSITSSDEVVVVVATREVVVTSRTLSHTSHRSASASGFSKVQMVHAQLADIFSDLRQMARAQTSEYVNVCGMIRLFLSSVHSLFNALNTLGKYDLQNKTKW